MRERERGGGTYERGREKGGREVFLVLELQMQSATEQNNIFLNCQCHYTNAQ